MKLRRLATLFASTMLLAPAGLHAQGPVLAPNPSRPQVDANGVDIQSQKLSYSAPMLSIGPKDHRGLDYSIFYNGGAFRNSMMTLLEVDSVSSRYTFTLGSHSEEFGGFTSDELAMGATHIGTMYYDRNGARSDFSHSLGLPGTLQYYLADFTEYADGTRITYHYRDDTSGGLQYTRLQSVTTNTGWQLKFNYQVNTIPTPPASVGPWQQITSVVAINNAVEYCDPDADTCSLVNAWPQMAYVSGVTEYQDAAGGTTIFDISTFGRFKIQTPDSSTFNIDYTLTSVPTPGGSDLRVTQAVINGKTTAYSFPSPYTAVIAAAPLGQTTRYNQTWAVPGVTSVVDPLLRTTSYLYDGNRRVTQITPPEGDYRYFNYLTTGGRSLCGIIGEAGHAVKTGASGIAEYSVWSYDFGCTAATLKACNSPLDYSDMKGQWSYEYDATHGGMLTNTSSVNGNGLRTVIRYAYAQRYAWIKNSGGSYVQAPTPIWVRTTEKSCRDSNTVSGACAAGASDETTITYDYGPNSGPNNLLVRGKTVTANGVSLLTCYGYDNLGNKISETTPNAGLGSCP